MYENMLNITDIRKVQVQTTITSHMLERLLSKRQTDVGKAVEQRELLCSVGKNVIGIATVENNMEMDS